MQEHLIPQDISNYKFHLIGELDLKQFGEVMAGVIVAVIINAMGWPGIVAWPLMIISVGIGLLAAFVPMGGQPLSHWVIVFFKALFSPTKFYWRKQTVIPSYFTYELPARNREFLEENSTFNDTPARKHKALAYFSTLSSAATDQEDPLERFTTQRIAKATADFVYEAAPVEDNLVAPKKLIAKPQVGNEQSVRQRQIVTPKQETLDSFLETSSIFQPAQVMEQITAVDDRMANSDSTLAAALNEGATAATQEVAPSPVMPEPAATMPIANTPDTITPAAVTPAATVATAPSIAPASTMVSDVSVATFTPATSDIVLPELTTPEVNSITTNPTLNSDIILPDLSAPTAAVSSPVSTASTTGVLELPDTPVLSQPPKPPLKIA